MILPKYEKIYKEFIKKYEEIHINPWHEISKDKLNIYVDKLINDINIDNEYNFKYFIDYLIKKLSGKIDAHTKYRATNALPINFKIIEDKVFVNYPVDLSKYYLVSINNVSIDKIFDELDEVITYGTNGKKIFELEKSLYNEILLYGLPSLRNSEQLEYKLVDFNGNIIKKIFKKNDPELKKQMFDFNKYLYGHPGNYKILNNVLLYEHSSVQKIFEDQIIKSIIDLEKEDLSNIKYIIIDLRGNTGGNSNLNKYLIEFLERNRDKKLICLTDYRVFSAGRFALNDLIKLGVITIGEEIGTPLNCFGDCKNIEICNRIFAISSKYFNPLKDLSIASKTEFNYICKDLDLEIFVPDVIVRQNIKDYLDDKDTVLEYAINYVYSNIKKYK